MTDEGDKRQPPDDEGSPVQPLPATPRATAQETEGLRAWLELDLSALRSNVAALRETLTPGTEVLAVIKANAYGLGAREVAAALLAEPALVEYLGVAEWREGRELRQAGIRAPILLLGASLEPELPEIVRHGLTPTVATVQELRALEAHARDLLGFEETQPLHIGVDSGMNRHGCTHEELADLLAVLAAEGKHLTLDGLYTHLSSPGEPTRGFTHHQLSRLFEAFALARQYGFEPQALHAASSAAVLNYPAAQCTMIRLGLGMYGVDPGFWAERGLSLAPVASLKARVAAVRTLPAGEPVSYGRSEYLSHNTRLATLAIGYADGVRRELSGRGHVLLHGTRCPIVGKVTMDATMIDVGHLPAVRPGDVATLLGRDDHAGVELALAELAETVGTIPYDILCGLGRRVPRVIRRNLVGRQS